MSGWFYLTGYQTSILAVYILPIGFAVIDVGPAFAVFLAVASVAISIGSDFIDDVGHNFVLGVLMPGQNIIGFCNERI